MSKPDLAPTIPPSAQRWTRIDAYLGGLTRRRTGRPATFGSKRSEPEAPRAMLSTIPFAALIAVMAVLIVAFAVAAWPGSQPQLKAPPAARQLGTAPKGWFDEAKKEFR
jgi:hypothetical protein